MNLPILLVYFLFFPLESISIVGHKKNYLPIEVGNFWQLDNSQKNEIIGTAQINNKLFFVFVYKKDTAYYRIENNKILVKEHSESIAKKFDLTAAVNDTWLYNSWKVTLKSKTVTIEIGNNIFPNCYHYFFNVPNLNDVEHSIYLAPGIGFIQETCGECVHPIRKLVKARINKIDFDY